MLSTTCQKTQPMADRAKASFVDRFRALKNLPRFIGLVWHASPRLTVLTICLRIVRSTIPVSILYVGKLIIDQIVSGNIPSGPFQYNIWVLLGVELGLALLYDVLGRIATLTDNLLGDLFSNHTSVKIMQHAAKLDLEQFEDSHFYDKLERARQQTVGRTVLLSQVLGQLQDLTTITFLALGLVAFNPWLLLFSIVAALPAFIGESYFNDQNYSLSRRQTPERRELDYVRYIGASDETAKEVKLFNLSDFLIERFQQLSNRFYRDNKALAVRRSLWGMVLSSFGTIAYYGAYAFVIFQAIDRRISLGDLTFLIGSFRQLRGILDAILARFTTISQGAIYLQDFFDFFEIRPTIGQAAQPIPFPNPIREGFVFENVGFKYAHTDKWANRNVRKDCPGGRKRRWKNHTY